MEETVIYERSTIKHGEGQVFQTNITKTGLVRFVWLETDEFETETDDVVFLPHDAIAAARAILKHFGEA